LFFSILLFSCDNTGDCTDDEPVAQLNITFVKKDTLAKTGKKDTILTFRKIFALGSLSNFRSDSAKLSRVDLSFNPKSDETTFVLDRSTKSQKIIDTIVISYRRQYRLLSTSASCPPRVEFKEIMLEYHSFDSLYVNPKSADENVLEVYFAK
jgi:hypothetical protein